MSRPGVPQLQMIIEDMSSWQMDWELPDGYEAVTYAKGREHDWVTIIGESFDKAKTVDDWRELIVAKEGYRPDRVFFIRETSTGEMCATATAVRNGGPEHGYLHFVGVRPKWSGRRLGFLVSCMATESFKADGCIDAALNTDPPRVAALKTYLRIGYRPLPVHDAHVDIWRRILAQTGFEHLTV